MIENKRRVCFVSKFAVLMLVVSCFLICFAAVRITGVRAEASASRADDTEYYKPQTVESAGWAWGDSQQIYANPDGSVHIEYTDCKYSTIRTNSKAAFKLDGLHIKIKNFTGDGMCIAFANSTAPDPSDQSAKAFRLVPKNASDYTAVMRVSTPDWSVHKYAYDLNGSYTLATKPISSDFDIKVSKASSGWHIEFNGQTFVFTDEEMDAAVPDKNEVYVSFSAYIGNVNISTFSFDYASVHGGEVRCADTLNASELAAIDSVREKIDAIGKVSNTQACKSKIDAAAESYNALDPELYSMITNADTLTYAIQNYYVFTHPTTFDESNVVNDIYMITDNHLDTNDCTSYDYGSPQDRFEWAISDICEAGADAILLGGDITDWARFDKTPDLQTAHKQINMFRDSMEKCWDKDVALFFTMGNHDSSVGQEREELFYQILGDSYYNWDVNKQDALYNTGCRHAKIKGFDFLTMSWDYTDENQNQTIEAIEWMESKLKAITSAPDYDGRPIFFLSHVPFGDTVYGSESMGERVNKYKLYNIMKEYPQIVALSGHSHYPLDNEKFVYQTDFTHLGASTTSYIGMPGDGFLCDGGYKVGSALMPADHIQSMGLRMEVDSSYNIRVTRIDFLHDGRQMYEQIVIPAPDIVNKTHLSYYSEARTSRTAAPQFKEGASVEADYVSETDMQVTFDTCTSDGIVQYYVIDFEHSGRVDTFKSYQGAWRYTSNSEVPDSKTVYIENFKAVKPYTVKVRAVDSFGNESNVLSRKYSVLHDKIEAAMVDSLILSIGDVSLNNDNYTRAVEAYNTLSYDQKKQVENYDTLAAAMTAYDNLFTTVEQYRNKATVAGVVRGVNYWADTGWLKYDDDVKGINVTYDNAVPNVTLRLKSFNLDGLHMTFDSLEKDPSMSRDPSIGIILGGVLNSQFKGDTADSGILLFLDTNEGKLEAHPGPNSETGNLIVKGDALKYRNMKNREWDIRFTKLESGDFLVEICGLRGVLSGSYFDGSYNLKNTAKTFVGLSCWVDGGKFGYRLISIHDGSAECHDSVRVAKEHIVAADSLVDDIASIGTVTLESESAILAAEKTLSAIPANLRYLVTNEDTLTAARASLDALKAQQGNNGGDNGNNSDNEGGGDNSGGGKSKSGCRSALGEEFPLAAVISGAAALVTIICVLSMRKTRREKQ